MCSNVKPDIVLASSAAVSEGSVEEQLQDWDEEDEDDGEMQVLCRVQEHTSLCCLYAFKAARPF